MKYFFASVMIVLTMFATNVSVASQPAAAAGCSTSLLGIPAWYRGLIDNKTCNIVMPKAKSGEVDVQKAVFTIALNVIQAGLVLVAYVTISFIIKGGFGYITSAGSPDGMSSAKKTITNAIIGMVIAIFAASIVNAVAGLIK